MKKDRSSIMHRSSNICSNDCNISRKNSFAKVVVVGMVVKVVGLASEGGKAKSGAVP